ncbi:MAG: hypothetical protein AAF243_12470, partial [Cyanobacteria bacterium P01_A01_bin.137]
MRIVKRTDSELVIQSPNNQKKLIFPLSVLGITALIAVLMVVSGQLIAPVALLLIAAGAYGLYILYGALRSETLIFDKTANEVRCDRKTPLGTKTWQLQLSTLQNMSVGKSKQRYKKPNGHIATRWSYNLTFMTNNEQKQEMLYYTDGESVDTALLAIENFLGPLAASSANQPVQQFSTSHHRMRVTPEYKTWRETIFNIQPSQVGVFENDSNRVYGVLMDVGMLNENTSERWAMSLTALLSGEASFQTTPGGDMVGLGDDPEIAHIAQEIVQFSQTLL